MKYTFMNGLNDMLRGYNEVMNLFGVKTDNWIKKAIGILPIAFLDDQVRES
ncbi:MAG: hypothetical protein IMW92_10155 [Bacillales bacterium]|nr:hypothetical protein [Bacillales bacterium]